MLALALVHDQRMMGMTDSALFIGWGATAAGRERRAVELFGEQHRAAEVDRVQRLLTDLEQDAAPSVLGA